MKTGIYIIRNMENGKVYVGQSVDIENRKVNHFSKLRRGTHANLHLMSSCKQSGLSNFEFRILEETPENMLDIRECAWVEYYKSNQAQFGYNSETGGHANKHLSVEHRQKISAVLKGRIRSDEHKKNLSISNRGIKHGPFSKEAKKNMSKAHKGRKHSLETCRKISLAHKGRHPSKEVCQKMSESHKGKILSEEHRRKISESHKGILKGISLSGEHKNKLSIAHKGIPWSSARRISQNKIT
jgi:group I intron endonuclease